VLFSDIEPVVLAPVTDEPDEQPEQDDTACDKTCGSVANGCMKGTIAEYAACIFEAGSGNVQLQTYLDDVAVCQQNRTDNLEHCERIEENCYRICENLAD
jgi:hypothetical protein